ncbi:hypothetical protein GW777_07255 [Candidatus Peregrinibacteria bacterium]|uniref:Uncharacterized protein n=1 Tax=Candidatus Roizmanbacteria bacterium CG11_big_fil_rev_8_21_14_0_20_36_8 TaxID=1974856 RepID=A0A2M6ITT2_9BACT|nr:hypothetical protein [Candidatus Peregrinibacteria bacterium]PIQ73313.1 MAG: hypothetical protein COV58_03210 [Candidatus Roizmanbacteria bacterium CG11_big_fil_rev_8_21_14_0_20_36_8]
MEPVTIFGDVMQKEEVLVFKYEGEKFATHEININELISELKGVDVLIAEVVRYYKQKHNLLDADVSFEVLVKVEDGSIKEIIKIVKKNATTLTLISTFVMPFLQSGFDYYLNNRETDNTETVEILENSQKIRRSFEDILTPINGDGNQVSIQNGNITYNINVTQKEEIVDQIKRHEEALEEQENVVEEDLMGVVSISRYDDPNPFSFRVNETNKDIPLYFHDLEFNLEDRQEFLGQELVIKADVTYKNGTRKSITVKEYKELANLFTQ